jgi:hypothetical protein
MRMTELERGSDLSGVARANQDRRPAAPRTPLLGGVPCQLIGLDGPAAAADPTFELVKEAGRQMARLRGGGPSGDHVAYLSPGGDFNNGSLPLTGTHARIAYGRRIRPRLMGGQGGWTRPRSSG